MQVFVELLLFRVEEAELAARLAEAIERRPEQAHDALFLLRGDPRVQPLSNPSLLTLDEVPGEMAIGRDARPGEASEPKIAWTALPHLETDTLEVSLNLALPELPAVTWAAELPLPGDLTAFVLEPDLLVVVSPTILPDQEAMNALMQAKKEQRQRLEPMLDRERAIRRTVNALLEG